MNGTAASPALRELAAYYRGELTERILPYWHDSTLRGGRGGYELADDPAWRRRWRHRIRRPRATYKSIVTQARLVWVFAHAHRHGLGSGGRDLRAASTHGRRFLVEHFLDRRHGGFAWMTQPDGSPTVTRKLLYGQAFAVFALVEHAEVCDDEESLALACDVYRLVEQHLHDDDHGGWFEHADEDWRVLLDGPGPHGADVIGYKGGNAHLHWVEALTDLWRATGDPDVARSLDEAIAVCRDRFYPSDPARSVLYRRPDWSLPDDPRAAPMSYGHLAEFAWLMVRAEASLGREPSWDHFRALLDHTVAYGRAPRSGAFYYQGVGTEPAFDTRIVWWTQAEVIAAFTDALRHRHDPTDDAMLVQLLRFVRDHQTDPADGIWYDTVDPDGVPVRTAKAHGWKACYHDVRALVKLVEAFDQAGSSSSANP